LGTPGLGWVWCDGENESVPIRAGWATDADIAPMVAAYAPGRAPRAVGDGQVVVDMTHEPRQLEGQGS
jgi:hypothetical protein